jgi:4-hydroxy-tetrahydrodipicolinate synthase
MTGRPSNIHDAHQPVSRRGFLATLAGAAVSAYASTPSDKPLRGIFVIVATPYTHPKAVDYEDLAHEVEWLHRCGAHGIVWPQRASEYYLLSADERLRGFDVIGEAAKGKKPAVVFGVQGKNRQEAMKYLDHVERLSPDALIAIPPEEASSLEDYRSYYRTLASATKRPIFIQTTGAGDHQPFVMPVSFICELAGEHPNLGYVKDEQAPVLERMAELQAHKPPMKSVFSGHAGKGMLAEMGQGSDGTMPGASYTDVYVQIWDAWQAGDRTKAREIFARLLPLINLDDLAAQGYQYMLYRRGVFRTPISRGARPKLLPAMIAEIDYAFAELKPYLRV